MRNFLAITRKELYSLFTGPIAYVVLSVFFALTGFFLFLVTDAVIAQVQNAAIRSQQFGGPPPPIDAFGQLARFYFGIVSTFILFVVPMITMGVFSEEKKRGTVELLFTSPITNAQLILGKFTAVLTVLGLMLLPSLLNLLLLYNYSEPRPPLGPIFSGYLGALLLGGTLLAVGLFISSMTENQIVAGILTFGVFLVLWVLDSGAGTASSTTNEILGYVSVLNHYEDFSRGIIDTQNLVYYLSFIFLGLFLTSVSLDSVKWRQ